MLDRTRHGAPTNWGSDVAQTSRRIETHRKGFTVIRNFKRTASVVGVLATASIALAACGNDDANNTNQEGGDTPANETTAAATGVAINGEGASSQQNAMAVFGAIYQDEVEGGSLNYTASGSGSGRTNFVAGQVDFAGSDSPLKDDQVEDAAERCGGNEAWHLPFVIGPVAIAYNLDGVDELNLSIETLAKIFNGEITEWNDDAIAAENEGVELPEQSINVFYRSDESGTSDNFQKFLSTATPENWDGEGQQFPQEVGAGANGSNGVATEVTNTPGGITYVEYGFAIQNDLGVANLDFGAGPIELNSANVNTALEALEFESEGHNMVVNTDALFAQTGEGSYPLILTTYEIVCSAGYDQELQDGLKQFLEVSLENQDQIAEHGFIPVEGAHKDRLAEAIAAIGEGA